MIFVHGVRFSAKHPSLDGASQASRGDLVVVVINYRQVAFGYLALEDGITNGNYGLADQIIALDWVRANIHDFGGDPERITIVGQPWGSTSVAAMLGSPMAIGEI